MLNIYFFWSAYPSFPELLQDLKLAEWGHTVHYNVEIYRFYFLFYSLFLPKFEKMESVKLKIEFLSPNLSSTISLLMNWSPILGLLFTFISLFLHYFSFCYISTMTSNRYSKPSLYVMISVAKLYQCTDLYPLPLESNFFAISSHVNFKSYSYVKLGLHIYSLPSHHTFSSLNYFIFLFFFIFYSLSFVFTLQ